MHLKKSCDSVSHNVDASASKKPFSSDLKTPISGGLGKFIESASLEATVAIGLCRDKLLHNNK